MKGGNFMLNQPQFIFSYTIPYYITEDGESIELFVSEKTYELYLAAQKNYPFTIVSGNLHPLGSDEGEITVTLFDKFRAIIIIGTKDIKELSNELIDIAIATELERINLFEPTSFQYSLYLENTPLHKKVFIDDIQHTLENIYISKRLIQKGYRIIERENETLNNIVQNKPLLQSFKILQPTVDLNGLFILNKLFYIFFLDKEVYKHWKKEIHPFCPQLFNELETLFKEIKKLNITTVKGRQKAFKKLTSKMGYNSYIKLIKIEHISDWELPNTIS